MCFLGKFSSHTKPLSLSSTWSNFQLWCRFSHLVFVVRILVIMFDRACILRKAQTRSLQVRMRQCRASTPAQILRRRIEVVCVSNVWLCKHALVLMVCSCTASVVRESVTSLAGNTTCFDRKRFQLDSASALGVSNQP